MRAAGGNHREETYEQWRSRMLAETVRFIEWGLQNPEKVEWIPRHRVGQGAFSDRVKTMFWTLVASQDHYPD